MYKIPELLAPVGGPEQLRAAVENGADAVYMGGALFNARINADNFTQDSMREAIEYAHMRGAQVHVTLNTLLKDGEVAEALRQAVTSYEAGADAFIIQDLGFAALLRKHFPEMVLHLSTQGTIYNLEGVKKAAELGFSRVVLARELPLEEIRRITEATETEIEVFIHGALCMSYSGQCQMSRDIGSRSGNRGQCAQPCRLAYELYRETSGSDSKEMERIGNGYLLSPKDICTIDHLADLAQSGVASIKIEGRMKSPEYVAVVTGIYRKYLDEYAQTGSYQVVEEDRLALNQIFSRGAFTTGYLLGNPRQGLLSGELPKHQGIKIGNVVSYNPQRRTAMVNLRSRRVFPLSMGDGVEIRNAELSGNVITYIRGNEIGYLSGNISPGDAIYKITDKALLEKARASYEGKSGSEQKTLRKRDVTMRLYIRAGEPVVLTVRDTRAAATDGTGRGPVVEERSEICAEAALNRPLDEETVKKQLDKTGGTPFRLAALDLDMGGEAVTVRMSVLNELRRNALSRFEEILCSGEMAGQHIEATRLEKAIGEIGGSSVGRSAVQENEVKLSYYLFAADAEMLELAEKEERMIAGIGRVPVSRYYLPYELFLDKQYEQALLKLRMAGKETIPFLPAVTRGREDEFLQKKLPELIDIALVHGISVGNLAQIDPFVKAGAKVYGDFGLNFYNSSDLLLAKDLGLCGTVLSNETLPGAWEGRQESLRNRAVSGALPSSGERFDYARAAAAAQRVGIELEAVAGGSIPLMTSAHCPIGDTEKGCPGCFSGEKKDVSDVEMDRLSRKKGLCGVGRYYLKDRKSKFYSILTRKADCQMLLFRRECVIDSEFAGEVTTKGIVNLRFYGIDKKIFCG